MRLPGVCISCRQPVVWNGKRWRAPGQWGRAHVCKVKCGSIMPQARERCACKPHAGLGHRTSYAIDNARRARGIRRAPAQVK